ncbi:MAG: DNA-binding domain-containing protein [Cyanobacteriota bacterium]|nr:DNA-binding domain-containing protein [Cyanobacteriota bacterium]
MATVSVGVRLPDKLHDKLLAYIERTGESKSETIVNALASYLNATDAMSLRARLAEVERRLAVLETQDKVSEC